MNSPLRIPALIEQGDSAYWLDDPWTDDNGKVYDSASYTLAYVIAGPIATPLTLTAAANGSGWKTSLTTTQAATLAAGQYWWQAVLTATGERVTLGKGELTVVTNLANAGANYSGKTVAEQALADAETALANFKASGGLVRSYSIGSRQMVFQDTAQILNVISYWKGRVLTEGTAAKIAQGLGNPRKMFVRFS